MSLKEGFCLGSGWYKYGPEAECWGLGSGFTPKMSSKEGGYSWGQEKYEYILEVGCWGS